MEFHNDRLANDLDVIVESNPDVHSVALQFLVRTGSRDETADVSGVSHFLEHMAFKGTDQYSAEDVNRVFDEIGADNNASTTQEVTEFHAVVLPEYLPIAFEVLSGIIYPTLRDDDFQMERNVILEEIGMYQDQPSWVAYERAMERYFAGHPLSNSILGTNESIGAMTAEQMREYHQSRYRAGNITLAVAGKTTFEEVRRLAEQHCGHWPSGTAERAREEARPKPSTEVITRHSSLQEQVIQLCPAPPADHDLRYAADLLTVIVGDSSGSRLYWDLVDTGAAEAAEIGYHDYDGSGTYMTFLSCEPEDTAANMQRISEIYEDVNRNGVTAIELSQAKNKVASRVVLSSERPMGRLSSLGNNWVYRGEYRNVDRDLRTIRGITLREIRDLLDIYPLAQTTTCAIGPLDSLSNGQ